MEAFRAASSSSTWTCSTWTSCRGLAVVLLSGNTGSAGAGAMEAFRAASSSSTSLPSMASKRASRLSPANSPIAAVSASRDSTFSSMRSKAAMAESVLMPLTAPSSCFWAWAAWARALRVSFLVLAWAIWPSNFSKLRFRTSTWPAWDSNCLLKAWAVSSWVLRCDRAWRAKSSSPPLRANWARPYQ